VVHDGKPELSHQREVAGFPIRSTAVAVHTIGAGGSSIARIDSGGLLHVGPESVGADPGPACYDRGGRMPTVTDANVVLGRLNPQFLLGGTLRIDCKRAAAAIEEFIARPLRIGVTQAAAAILAVSNNNIAQAVRLVSTSKGLDPADYTLVAYGGAGPLHATSVAAELGISQILIPAGPGILCALGVLTKDVAMDVSMSRLMTDDGDDVEAKVRRVFSELEQRAQSELKGSGASIAGLQFTHTIDARYTGQNFELPVPIEIHDGGLREQIRARFHAEHRKVYGFVRETSALELVTFRLRAVVATARPSAANAPRAWQHGKPVASRMVVFEESDSPLSCELYERASLAAGQRIAGPAIIEQMDTTTIVPPGFAALVHASGNLFLSPSEGPQS
jgi:N-methylhydantoinase A